MMNACFVRVARGAFSLFY